MEAKNTKKYSKMSAVFWIFLSCFCILECDIKPQAMYEDKKTKFYHRILDETKFLTLEKMFCAHLSLEVQSSLRAFLKIIFIYVQACSRFFQRKAYGHAYVETLCDLASSFS